MCKAMAHHWGAHKARPAQLLRACHGQHNGSPLGRAQGAPGVTAPRLPCAKQWLTTGARTRRARRNCSALGHERSNGFSNGWRAGKGMWQSLHFHKSSVKPMAWCARPRLHAKGKAIVGQKPCAKQFSRARFMRAPKECNCRAIVQALCKNARGHRIGP